MNSDVIPTVPAMDAGSSKNALRVPCCPDLQACPPCDVLDFHYRLIHTAHVGDGRAVPVEVLLHVRLERCTGPLALGDLVYNTTLLPGEKVRLFTTDRRTNFTFDSETKVSYRNQQTTSETYFMASMADMMSDVNIKDHAHSTNTQQGSATGHGETSGALSTLFGSPSVDVSGSYNASSTSDFVRELSQHASASSHRVDVGARASNSVSVGEVSTRTHTQGESEDHFESSSREFSNPNHCHAVTFFFYQINKMQTVRLTLESITRRVLDPAGDTKITQNPFVSDGDVSPIPNGILATSKDRLVVEEIGRTAAAARQNAAVPVGGPVDRRFAGTTFATQGLGASAPLSASARQQALQQVDEDLTKHGLLTAVGGVVAPEAQASFKIEITTCLPTAGVMVKGCLDDCDICEDAVDKAIELDLENKRLQNELLKRQIELLDKSREYRCCADGSTTPA